MCQIRRVTDTENDGPVLSADQMGTRSYGLNPFADMVQLFLGYSGPSDDDHRTSHIKRKKMTSDDVGSLRTERSSRSIRVRQSPAPGGGRPVNSKTRYVLIAIIILSCLGGDDESTGGLVLDVSLR
ncbi:uncharacterized protein METZ01_LOCUS156287 [marine metagenome]|uniref:Uncharacterized protein n=1 Tax=marine metagenome TaxID=408172 RepID=A0A382AQW8_9ZZZZ